MGCLSYAGSNGDCVTRVRGMLQVKHIIWLSKESASHRHVLNWGWSLASVTSLIHLLSETRMQFIFQWQLPQNSSLFRRGWEFCKRWSAGPGLSQQRFMLVLSILLHRMVPAAPASVQPLFSTSTDLALTCYTRTFCFTVTSNTNMQNLAFIKNVLLFLFSVQNRLFGTKSKICLIKGEQSIIQSILITMRGGRRWCLDMLVTYLLCVPHIPVVDGMPAVEITLPMK